MPSSEVTVMPEAGRPDTTKTLSLAGGLSLEEIKSIGTVFFQSGMFTEAKSAAQAITKVLAGQEMGIPPMAAMRGLYVSKKGNIEFMTGLMGALVKRSGKYDYDILEASDTAVVLRWKQRDDAGRWQVRGETDFTRAEAEQAALDSKETYKAYTEDMLFARALSRGCRRFCPDIFFGAVYAVGETAVEDHEKPPAFVQHAGDYKPPRVAQLHEDSPPAEDTNTDQPSQPSAPKPSGQPEGELFPPSQDELDALAEAAAAHRDPEA